MFPVLLSFVGLITWLDEFSTRARLLSRHTPLAEDRREFCYQHQETRDHLFFTWVIYYRSALAYACGPVGCFED